VAKRRGPDGRPLAAPTVTGGAARESWVDSRRRAGHPVGRQFAALGRQTGLGASANQPTPCRIRELRRCSQLTTIISSIEIAISIVAAAAMVRLMLSLMPANICRGSVR